MQPGIVAAAGASDTVRGFYQTLLYNLQYVPSLGQLPLRGGPKSGKPPPLAPLPKYRV